MDFEHYLISVTTWTITIFNERTSGYEKETY